MPIIATLIARGSTRLVEYAPPNTNFGTIAKRLIEQIPNDQDGKKSYTYENHVFHYMVDGGIIYLCMANQDMGYRVPFAFLLDLKTRFKGTYGEKVYTAGSMEMHDSFSRVLLERIDFFSNSKNIDSITRVKGEIEDAKTIMVQNIDKVLERGGKIEILVDKTEELNSHSQSFKQKSTKLKRHMWWKNCKMCCVLVFVIAIILLVGLTLVLWKTGVLQEIEDAIKNNKGTSTGTSTTAAGTSTTAGTATTAATTATTATTAATTATTAKTTTTGTKSTTTTDVPIHSTRLIVRK